MTPALRASARHWLLGTALAGLGVALARGLAPQFTPRPAAALALVGQFTALAGLAVIVAGIRRRIRQSQASAEPSA